MGIKAKELNNLKDGDRAACPICNLNDRRIPLWKVWEFSLRNPGIEVFK